MGYKEDYAERQYNSFNAADMEDNGEIIKVKARYTYCVFPRYPAILGQDDNNYGITKWRIMDVEEGNPIENNRGELTVIGNFYEPIMEGEDYQILAKKVINQYGVQYELIYIREEIDLSALTNQRAFLKTFLKDGQIEEFYRLYENPLEIIEKGDKEAMMKVHGVGPYIVECILERYEKTRDMSKVYIELDNYGLTPNFLQKLVQRYKNPNTIIQVVKENPYRLMYDMEGVGFKTADKIALNGGLDPRSTERVKAYILYFLEKQSSEEGHSYITAGELIINIYNFFDGKANILIEYKDDEGNVIGTNISRAIQELVDIDKIAIEDNENKSLRRIYLKKIYQLEYDIAYHLNRLLHAPNRFHYVDWEQKVKELEKKQGFEFAEEQKNGIKLGLDKQVCLISGLAGSGKSSLVSGILAALDEYTFAQCALSGKAAARLQEVTGHAGSTIHRLLGYTNGGFTFNEENPLEENIIILDEVSLVGGEIFLDLIKAIPDGSKLIMLGDMGQLESIGALNLAADIYNSPYIPTVELKEIHRQAAKSGIITSAHSVRKQEIIHDYGYEGIDVQGELKDMIFDISSHKDDILNRTIAWFDKWFNSSLVEQDIMKIQLIAPIKERGDACVYNLNIRAQQIVNPSANDNFDFNDDDFDDDDSSLSSSNYQYEPSLIVGSKGKQYEIREHDKVMCIKNNYKTTDIDGYKCPIFNGWTGMVEKITDNYIYIDFPLAGGIVVIPLKDAKSDITLGYAATVHKLQGSDIPVVIGALDYSTPPTMLTSQLVYTLLTRAKKRCILVAQLGALNKAIITDYVSTKRTFLQELVEQIEKEYQATSNKKWKGIERKFKKAQKTKEEKEAKENEEVKTKELEELVESEEIAENDAAYEAEEE